MHARCPHLPLQLVLPFEQREIEPQHPVHGIVVERRIPLDVQGRPNRSEKDLHLAGGDLEQSGGIGLIGGSAPPLSHSESSGRRSPSRSRVRPVPTVPTRFASPPRRWSVGRDTRRRSLLPHLQRRIRSCRCHPGFERIEGERPSCGQQDSYYFSDTLPIYSGISSFC